MTQHAKLRFMSPSEGCFLNESWPKDGFVCENHVVSSVIPLILKTHLDMKLHVRPVSTKPQTDRNGKHPPGSLCWKQTAGFIFLTHFVCVVFFLLIWRNPLMVWVCRKDFPFMRCHNN